MGKALGIIWRGVVDTYNELFPMIGMNVLWVIPSFLFAVILTGLALQIVGGPSGGADEGSQMLLFFIVFALVTVMPNPAAAGIHNFANQLVKEERVEFALVWEGLRLYWAKAFALFGIGVGGLLILLVNISFYLRATSQVLNVIGILFIYATLIWIAMQMYMLPLLIEQQTKSIRYVVRNAAILVVTNPLVTLTLLVFVFVLAVISVPLAIFIALISGSLVNAIQHRAVLTLLEKYRTSGQAG